MDVRIQQRQKNFKPKGKNKINIALEFDLLSERTNTRLTLRKEKLDTLIMNKSLKSANPEDWEERQLKIDIKELSITQEMNYYFDINDDQQLLLRKLLQDNDKDVVKFALKKLSILSNCLKENDEGDIDLDDEVFEMAVFYLFEDPDLKIKVMIFCH